MPKDTTEKAAPSTELARPAETQVAKINAFLATTPTVEEDPTESMLALVLNATSPSEWGAIFQSESLKDYAGRQVRLNAYRTAKSDFEGGLEHYLILDATDLKTGERIVLTCSSVMSIAQVLNAQARGVWPIDVEIVQKDKPTKAGFRPIHLRYLKPGTAPLGDPQAVVSEQ